MEPPTPRLVLLASGTGTNVQAVLDACAGGLLPAEVVAVVSDRAGAMALDRARARGVAAVHVGREAGENRVQYDQRLADVVAGFEPDHVVLLGWMRILTRAFVDRFPGRLLNLHPALPGELPGTDAIGRAFEQFQRGERTRTGVMVHLVDGEGVDDGPVLATAEVPIADGDTVGTLTERVHATEHRLIVATLAQRCAVAAALTTTTRDETES